MKEDNLTVWQAVETLFKCATALHLLETMDSFQVARSSY